MHSTRGRGWRRNLRVLSYLTRIPRWRWGAAPVADFLRNRLAAARSGSAAPRFAGAADGAQGRIRTTDTLIFSQVLYQLSYLGTARAGPHG